MSTQMSKGGRPEGADIVLGEATRRLWLWVLGRDLDGEQASVINPG